MIFCETICFVFVMLIILIIASLEEKDDHVIIPLTIIICILMFIMGACVSEDINRKYMNKIGVSQHNPMTGDWELKPEFEKKNETAKKE